MKKFFGIAICMASMNMPAIECHLSKKPFYGYDVIKNSMSRNRLFLLLRVAHFNENETFE